MSIFGSSQLYNEVDFVPAWYRRKEANRRSTKRQMVMVVVLVAGMAALLVQNWHTHEALASYADQLTRKLESTKMQITEATKLRAQQAALDKQLRVHRELHKPIDYSHIIGTMAHIAPPSISMRDLSMETEKVTYTRPIAAGDKGFADSAKGKGAAGAKPRTVTESYWVVSVELEGIAPNDRDVANFIGELAASKVFQNVKMIYSKAGTFGPYVTRNFRIRMEVPLDCKYEDANRAKTGEVANAR
ncbi:MAG: hypothetical protein GC162_02180 [Planctomycetes bacterium]|nr:hypothetical protein [Planctomycetota bacterium]